MVADHGKQNQAWFDNPCTLYMGDLFYQIDALGAT